MSELYATRFSALRSLGFANYQEYLHSSLWQEIRARVLRRDRNKCKCCQAKASQVHHGDYSYEFLSGDSLDMLYSLCSECHKSVEFDGTRKRKGNAVVGLNEWLGSDKILRPRVAPAMTKKEKGINRAIASTARGPVVEATSKQRASITSKCAKLGISPDTKRLKSLTRIGYSEWMTELDRTERNRQASQ